jgi:hypothetical protein
MCSATIFPVLKSHFSDGIAAHNHDCLYLATSGPWAKETGLVHLIAPAKIACTAWQRDSGQPALSDLSKATELAVASVEQLLILLVPRNLRRPTRAESQAAIDLSLAELTMTGSVLEPTRRSDTGAWW